MENKTKVWLVTAHNSGLIFGGGIVTGVFLSKKEAEFYVWQKNRQATNNPLFIYISYYSSPTETEVLSMDLSGKEFEKFRKEQVKKIDDEIEKNAKHSAEDLERVEALKREKELL